MLYTLRQLEEMSSISYSTLRKLVATGTLPAVDVNVEQGGPRPTWRVRQEDWEAFLASRTNQPAAKKSRRKKKQPVSGPF